MRLAEGNSLVMYSLGTAFFMAKRNWLSPNNSLTNGCSAATALASTWVLVSPNLENRVRDHFSAEKQ
jgi:hypothetical protein